MGLLDQLWRSALLFFASAVVLHFGWQLLRPLLVPLAVLCAALIVARFVLSFRRRSEW